VVGRREAVLNHPKCDKRYDPPDLPRLGRELIKDLFFAVS
jgi:hypothetical protein